MTLKKSGLLWNIAYGPTMAFGAKCVSEQTTLCRFIWDIVLGILQWIVIVVVSILFVLIGSIIGFFLGYRLQLSRDNLFVEHSLGKFLKARWRSFREATCVRVKFE